MGIRVFEHNCIVPVVIDQKPLTRTQWLTNNIGYRITHDSENGLWNIIEVDFEVGVTFSFKYKHDAFYFWIVWA